MVDRQDAPSYVEERIDPMRYGLILWDRRRMIIVLTVLVALAAGAVSMMLPKEYEVTAALRLGRAGLAGDQSQYIARADDVVQLVKKGSFAKVVLEGLSLDEARYAAMLMSDLNAHAAGGGEIIYLNCLTAEPEVGIKVTNSLIKHIKDAFNPRAERQRAILITEIDQLHEAVKILEVEREVAGAEIEALRSQIAEANQVTEVSVRKKAEQIRGAKEEIAHRERRVENLAAVKGKLEGMLGLLENNTQELLRSREALPTTQESDAISGIVLANNIQNGINLVDDAYDRVKTCELQISDATIEIERLRTSVATFAEESRQLQIENESAVEQLEQEIEKLALKKDKELPAKIQDTSRQIARLEINKDAIEDIEVVAEAAYLKRAVKPNLKKNVLASGFAGGIGAALLAFVLAWAPQDRGSRRKSA